MPTIYFYGPELEKEKKQQLVKEFTETASRLTGIPQAGFVVYLQAVDRENVGVGGELLCDKQK